MAKPPTVTHIPIAKPKYSESVNFDCGNGEDYKGENIGEHEHCNDDLAPHAGRWPQYNKAAQIPPRICTPMYIAPSPASYLPRPEQTIAVVTAGLKRAPETELKAKIMHMSDAAIENAAAAEPPSTFSPTVSTSM